MQNSPFSLPFNIPLNMPKEKANKPWSENEKQTVVSLGASGMKAEKICPYVPGRTRAAVQAILTRNLATWKVQRTAQQNMEINNLPPPPPQPQFPSAQPQGTSRGMIYYFTCFRLSH
jgi:hypothetical protein